MKLMAAPLSVGVKMALLQLRIETENCTQQRFSVNRDVEQAKDLLDVSYDLDSPKIRKIIDALHKALTETDITFFKSLGIHIFSIENTGVVSSKDLMYRGRPVAKDNKGRPAQGQDANIEKTPADKKSSRKIVYRGVTRYLDE